MANRRIPDPRRLKPGQLLRLVNSTPAGAVLTAARLAQHRAAAGTALGPAGSIDLFRYAAWLWRQKPPTVSPETSPDLAGAYARKKTAERERNAAKSRAGRNIAPLPTIADPVRRAEGLASLKRFCEIYFPERFTLAWSADHVKAIARMEKVTVRGGQHALAMPRGTGKTSLCEVAAIWALFNGYRRFVVLVGASAEAAAENVDSIKAELEGNERLKADFPDVCYPIDQIDGTPNRQAGQHIDGQRTRMTWGKRMVILPTVDGSAASGGILRVAGITGRVRGMKFVRPDGQSARPDLVIVDDPQTDRSARSVSQCLSRLKLITGAVLRLAGPAQKIAAMCPCTVIRRDDVADQLLDRKRHPEWQGERTKLIYRWPDSRALWDQYRGLRRDELAQDGDGSGATAFYAAHRKAMDAGSEVAWPARFEHDELSALQHAVNLQMQDEAAFEAEYQNEPPDDSPAALSLLSADAIAARVSGLDRGVAPAWATHVTAFIDVQQSILYHVVAAWRDDFTGQVLDYGTYPKQPTDHFTAQRPGVPLAAVAKGALEAQLTHGLRELVGQIVGRQWPRDGGAHLSVGKLLIDRGWEPSAEVIDNVCRSTPHGAIVMPSKGEGVLAKHKPWSERKRAIGETIGQHWKIPNPVKTRACRHVEIDTNWWKSFITQRLATPPGDRGGLALFGRAAGEHRHLCEHLTSEYPLEVTVHERTLAEWQLRPGRENHWWDCLVGAAVAASMLGVSLKEAGPSGGGRRPTISLAALQAERRKRQRR